MATYCECVSRNCPHDVDEQVAPVVSGGFVFIISDAGGGLDAPDWVVGKEERLQGILPVCVGTQGVGVSISCKASVRYYSRDTGSVPRLATTHRIGDRARDCGHTIGWLGKGNVERGSTCQESVVVNKADVQPRPAPEARSTGPGAVGRRKKNGVGMSGLRALVWRHVEAYGS